MISELGLSKLEKVYVSVPDGGGFAEFRVRHHVRCSLCSTVGNLWFKSVSLPKKVSLSGKDGGLCDVCLVKQYGSVNIRLTAPDLVKVRSHTTHVKGYIVRNGNDPESFYVEENDIIKPYGAPEFEVRDGGNFSGYGLYLPTNSRWVIVEDDEGVGVLLELRR